METIGLFLGKFCPYHNGHKSVIDLALRECSIVYVIVYDAPNVTDVPLLVRADWIAADGVRVILGYNAPQDEGYDDNTKTIQENYVKGLLNASGVDRIDRFYSSEPYGEHMSKALGAKDCRVDMDRIVVPMSGTAFREDPYGNRHMVPSVVHDEMVTKVLLLGAPSTGKTTLSRELAKNFDTIWMPEYGREYWEKNQISHRLTMDDLLAIQEGHKSKFGEMLKTSNRYLFCDTGELTTAIFGRYYCGNLFPDNEILFRIARISMYRYDIVLLCDEDIPFDDTADRSGPASRPLMQRMIIDQLEAWRIPYYKISGSLEQRVESVKKILSRSNKWFNKKEIV